MKETMKFCNNCGAKNTMFMTADSSTSHSINHVAIDLEDDFLVPTASDKQEHSNSIDSSSVSKARGEELVHLLSSHADDMNNLVAASNSKEKSTDSAVANNKTSRSDITERKSKVLAGILGLVLGYLGLQWFYLGKKTRGWIYLAVFFVTSIVATSLFDIYVYLCFAEGLFMIFSTKKAFIKYVG